MSQMLTATRSYEPNEIPTTKPSRRPGADFGRLTYVPMLASIGPRNVASLLVREAVMVSDDAGRRRCAEHSRWSKPTFIKCHRATELNCARPLEPRVASQ